MIQEIQQLKEHPIRVVWIGVAVAGLLAVYFFQRWDALAAITGNSFHSYVHFAFNKSLRLILNDLCMLWIIHLWFQNTSITRLAFWIQLMDTLGLLPLYLILKLMWEGDSEISSPLLSQFHRLIVNPTLMILLFPAIYVQRWRTRL
jgi:exosortase F-associated protein